MSPDTTDDNVRRRGLISADKMRKMTALSRRIKAEMIGRDMNMTQLAAFFGLQKDDLSRYYNKKGLPSPTSMLRMAAALNVAPNDIVPGWSDDDAKVVRLRGRQLATQDCPEFELKASLRPGLVLLHVMKEVPMDVALEIGRLIDASNAADRG